MIIPNVNQKFIALLIACAIFGAVFAPSTIRAQEREEKQQLVKISGEPINVRQCVQPVKDYQTRTSELLFRLRITNVSSRPVIVYRYVPAPFDARLGRTLADIQKRTFHFKERPTPAHAPPQRNFDEAAPTNEFRILQSNESFAYEAPTSAVFLESPDPQPPGFEGEFFVQLKAQTWVWEVEKAERLRQRWASYGEFFYQDVTVEPFKFTINKSGAATPRCDTQ